MTIQLKSENQQPWDEFSPQVGSTDVGLDPRLDHQIQPQIRSDEPQETNSELSDSKNFALLATGLDEPRRGEASLQGRSIEMVRGAARYRSSRQIKEWN